MGNLTRREFLKDIGAGAVAATAISGSACNYGVLGPQAWDPKAPPNIVAIIADDLGYGDLGCYGGTRIATPHLDALARRGVRFTDYYSNAPVCCPTRASFLTGQFPQRHGIQRATDARGIRGFSPNTDTIGTRLQSHGYRTGLFGKWHLGRRPEYRPMGFGFETFRGFLEGHVDYQSHISDGGRDDWWHDWRPVKEPGYSTDLITHHALAFIVAHQYEPFLAVVSHAAPHYPYQGPNDPAYRTHASSDPLKGVRPDIDNAYREMVERMDQKIGELIAGIGRLGLAHNTLVVFFSDNGPMAAVGDTAGLPGTKESLKEGGIRTPAMMAWPGVIPAGRDVETPLMSMDLLPTCLSLARLPVPTGIDGVDMTPVVCNGVESQSRALFWRFENQRAIRRDRWKLYQQWEPDKQEYWSLLNRLDESAQDWTNLADAYPSTVASLSSALDAWESQWPVRRAMASGTS